MMLRRPRLPMRLLLAPAKHWNHPAPRSCSLVSWTPATRAWVRSAGNGWSREPGPVLSPAERKPTTSAGDPAAAGLVHGEVCRDR